MFSFLASPKPFEGPIRDIQRRAIASWRAIHPDAEILLYGGEPGSFSEVVGPGVRHFPAIATSETGAPRFDALTEHASREARSDIQVYLNCDIILPPDFGERIAPALRTKKFLVVGQRIDLGEGVEFDLSERDWLAALRRLAVSGAAELHAPTGVDFFVFPRGLWSGLDPLIVGRGGYDGALLAFCLRRGVPIVDVSRVVPALHQFHGYGHLAGGFLESNRGAEALRNCRLHDVLHSAPCISDADLELADHRLVRSRARGDWLRAAEITVRYRWRMKYASYLLRAIWRFRELAGYAAGSHPKLGELLDGYRPSHRP